MKPLLKVETYTSESLPHEPVITNNMLNSTKTWQERFAEKIKPFCYQNYGKIYFGKKDGELRAEGILITIEQFISDLRKKDEVELIKMIPSHDDMMDEGCLEAIDKFSKNLKDYYENN